jgi:hypothetical protein
MIAKPIDLLRRQPGVLGRNDERGAQPGLFPQPLGDLPVVHCPGHGLGPVFAVDQLYTVQTIEDSVLDVPRIEELLPQEVQVRPWRAAGGGRGTGPGRQWRAGRIVVRLKTPDATLDYMVTPQIREVRVEGIDRGNIVVHVTVDQAALPTVPYYARGRFFKHPVLPPLHLAGRSCRAVET